MFRLRRQLYLSVKEQEFFQTKGFTNEPKRCSPCRQMKRAQVGNTSGSNTTGNSWTIGNNATTNGGYGANTYTTRAMFPATCSDCGKATEVPFEPRSGKPVYCSACFGKMRAG